MRNKGMKCMACNKGYTQKQEVTLTHEQGECVVVVQEVPAHVCLHCESRYIDTEVKRRISQKILDYTQDGASMVVIRYSSFRNMAVSSEEEAEFFRLRRMVEFKGMPDILEHYGLTEREQEVLLRYWKGETFMDIARISQLGNKKVQEIYNLALDRLRYGLSGTAEIARKMKRLKRQLREILEENGLLKELLFQRPDQKEKENGPEPEALPVPEQHVLDMAIADMGLPARVHNCLQMVNVRTLSDILTLRREDLLLLPHFGHKSLKDLEMALWERGLSIGMNAPRN